MTEKAESDYHSQENFFLRRGKCLHPEELSSNGNIFSSRQGCALLSVDSPAAASELMLVGGFFCFLCRRHLCSKFIDSPSRTSSFITYLLCDLGQINPLYTSIFFLSTPPSLPHRPTAPQALGIEPREALKMLGKHFTTGLYFHPFIRFIWGWSFAISQAGFKFTL